jgi:hypothetical protein
MGNMVMGECKNGKKKSYIAQETVTFWIWKTTIGRCLHMPWNSFRNVQV